MLFNSYGFIFLYLPIVLFGFFQLGRYSQKIAAAWLALASLFFYGYWNYAYVGLLLASIVGNYFFGLWLAKTKARIDAFSPQATSHKPQATSHKPQATSHSYFLRLLPI